GIVVDAAWLRGHGYSRQLLSHYVNAGWLTQPARGVYRRLRGSPTWQQLVVSLQTYLKSPLAIGGRTALELLGYAHYLPRKEQAVHLYGPKPPPGWLHKVHLDSQFHYHNDRRLFSDHLVTSELKKLASVSSPSTSNVNLTLTEFSLSQWDWKLI